MELIAELTALCGQGLRGLSSLPGGLPLSLFLAGLAGSLVHCVGMCGPFVLTQVMADADGSGCGGDRQRPAPGRAPPPRPPFWVGTARNGPGALTPAAP